ncbi:hypothetical protein [Fibrella forsythiae]|uniref:DUF3575 domain-containing protein n=1 Tax=Fibrella forsythiae TaxID=2817061 RepID=A0ABS3JIP6_9BACT|nr:hypothetical protein [Fibrella forsythiae]MBO0949875.1 hypothetical protein [Fibrella forsythiae]
MKTSLFVLGCLLLSAVGQAQDSIPLYSDAIAKRAATLRPSIGLDLYQAVWFIHSAGKHDSPATYAYPVSVTVYLPNKSLTGRGQSVYINAGYVAYGGILQRNIYQAGSGIHVRAGIEHTRRGLILGYGGIVSGWLGQASFVFYGPTFGDYQESIGQRGGIAIGGEGHVGAAIPFSSRLSLRMALRATLMGVTTNLRTPHLSGLDWLSEKQVSLGGSLQANLVFRL